MSKKQAPQIRYSQVLLACAILILTICISNSVVAFEGDRISTHKQLNPFGVEKQIYSPSIDSKIKEYPTINLARDILWIDSGDIANYKIIKLECGFTNCVMRYAINSSKDIALFDNKIKVTDLESGKDIDKNIEYYIRTEDTYEEISVNDYGKTTCNKDNMCSNDIIGKHTEVKTIENWKRYNGEVPKAGYYEVELRGQIEVGKAVDVKAYALGVEFTEHAVWNSSYTNGLVTYYNFTNLNMQNAVNTASNKLNLTGAVGLGNGIISGGVNMSAGATTDFLENRTITPMITTTYTLCGWWNVTTVDQYDALFALYDSDSPSYNQVCQFYTAATLDNLHCDAYAGGSANTVTVNIASLQNKWTFLCSQVNTTHHTVFVNGVVNGTVALGAGTTNNLQILTLGNDRAGTRTRRINGVLDEIGLWNKTLSAVEINDLYNSGAGLTYSADGADTSLSGTVNLLTPSNNTNFTSSSVSFSANATATNGNITNMTLYIWNATTITNLTSKTGTFNLTNWTQSGLSDAWYTWNVYTCVSNSTSSLCLFNANNRTFQVDASAPVMAYGSSTETDGAILPRGNIVINVTATDTNLKNISIYLYNSTYHLQNLSISTTSPLFRNHTQLGNDTYYFNATAQDTLGNNATLSTRTVTINTAGASMSVISSAPVDNYNSSSSTVVFACNLTTYGTNITSVTLNVNGTRNWTQTTGALSAGTINYNASFTNTTIIDGSYSWNCTALGNNANGSSVIRTLNVDTTLPVVDFVYPVNNTNYSATTWKGTINYTASDTNLAYCWYSTDNGATNTTIACGTNISGLTPNQYSTINNWIIAANDTVGNKIMNKISFNTLTTIPSVSLLSPTNNSYPNISLNNFYYNITSRDNTITHNFSVYDSTRTLVYTNSSIITKSNCYQETANASTATDGNCNLNYSGVYSLENTGSVNWVSGSIKNLTDGNWNTKAGSTITGYGSKILYVNYSKSLYYSSVTWTVRYTSYGSPLNISLNIPQSCLDYDPSYIYLQYEFSHAASNDYNRLKCKDSDAGYTQINNDLNHDGTGIFYEEQITWNGIDNNNLNVIQNTNLADGLYYWNVTMLDNFGNTNKSETRQLTVDTIKPSVTAYTPNGLQIDLSPGTNLTVNFTATDTNIASCWINYNGANATIPCNNNASILYALGINNLTVWANDSANNQNSSFTQWAPGIVLGNTSYNVSAFETSTQTLSLNYTLSNILSSLSTLTYNGTYYVSTVSCLGDICTATNTIDLPVLNAGTGFNFWWNITAYNGSAVTVKNSSVYTQNISTISLVSCVSGNTTLNFTAYDEQNRSRLIPYSFDGTFNYYLGTGTTYRELNLTDSVADNVTICMNPTNNYKINSIIAYSAPNFTLNYPVRNHFFQNHTINSTLQNIKLYLLKAASSTSFILQVQDENVQAVPNVLVEAQRCYPGVDTSETSFISRTDTSGLTTGNFEAETALYKFFITKNDRTLLSVTSCSKVVPQTAPYTLLFQLGTGYTSAFTDINNITNLNSTLTFNKTSSITTFIYVDTSGHFNYAVLSVKRLNFSGDDTTNYCSVNSSLSSGILVCSVPNDGTYTSEVNIYRTDGTYFDNIITTTNNLGDTFGYYGVFLGFFLIMICAFAFKFSEIAGIWLVNAAIFFCNFIGLIHFGTVFVTSSICLGIIITAVLDR